MLHEVESVDGQWYKVVIWEGEYLGSEISIDVETTVSPFHTRDHKPVVFQAFGGGSVLYLVRISDINRFLNRHFKSKLIGHNISFDTMVLSEHGYKQKVFDAYDDNRIYCTKLMYQLYVLGTIGKLPDLSSLKDCVATLLQLEVDKNHDIRTGFGEYLGCSYEQMPEAHLKYAALDVAYTYYLYKKLETLIKPIDKYKTMLTLHTQVKGDFALRHLNTTGIRVNLKEKDELKGYLEDKMWQLNQKMSMYGVVKGQSGVSANYEAAIKYLGLEAHLPKTETGKITSSSKALADYRHIEFIDWWCEYLETEKLTSFLTNLEDEIINPQFNTLLVTGRTSCSSGHNGINIQQLPKEGGVRDLFIPREGKVFVDIDYDAIELSTLAYCLEHYNGYSKMADILNTGKDLHTATASTMYGKDPGPCTKQNMGSITKDERNSAKAPNFSYGSNAHEETFIRTAKKDYGLEYTLEEAKKIKDSWVATYPEVETWFKLPFDHKDGKRWVEKEGRYKDTYEHYTLTGRKRAYCKYTEWLNHHFQGLAADGLKIALYNLIKAGYTVVSEVHDNITVEVDPSMSKQELLNVSKIMVDAMSSIIPGIRVGVEGRVCYHLGKDADEVHSLNYNNLGM